MRGLDRLVIAVTGASGGIGSEVCARLRGEGAIVYALDLSIDETDESSFAVDVTDAKTIETALEYIVEREGRVDGIVIGAGVAEGDIPAEELEIDAFDRTIGVNLRGAFITAQIFGRHFIEQRDGRIVIISSMSGTNVVNIPQKQSAYNASKAGVSALARSLASEWAEYGVRVNSVAPGYVDTALILPKKHLWSDWLATVPAARFAEPEEIAASIAFLLSDDAAYYYGSELLVDGGFSIR